MMFSTVRAFNTTGFLGMTGTGMRSFGWRPKQVPLKKWNIVKGDQVEVISGRYKKT